MQEEKALLKEITTRYNSILAAIEIRAEGKEDTSIWRKYSTEELQGRLIELGRILQIRWFGYNVSIV